MRKITGLQTLCFLTLLSLAIAIGITLTGLLFSRFPLGDFRGVVLLLAGIVLAYACAIATCRLFLRGFPLQEGYIEVGSRQEFIYHVYLLFYLLLFQPLTRSQIVPVPLMRVIYLALGARLGDNSYSAGTLLDPPLTEVGDNCIIGHDAVLICHAVEGNDLSLARIRMGNNVTIGAKAVIMPGVTIGDGAVIAVNAVVSKGTQVGSGERWGGIPARRLRSGEPVDSTQPV